LAELSKPDYQYIWSSGGAIVAPSNVKIQTGWTAEVPPYQWENWSQNRQDQAIAHVLQHGIAVWDSVTEYQAGKSYVTGGNGKLYVAVQTNTNQNPTTDTPETYWADVLKPGLVVFSTAGVSSWTVPSILKLGLKKAEVYVLAGGAGGGSNATAGGGGGAGGIATKLQDLTGVTSVSVTVGAGGNGATVGGGTPAQSGGNSSFGAFCSATGGLGATSASGQDRGDGGVGIGGDVNDTKGPGFQRATFTTTTISGKGGGDGGGASVEGGTLTGLVATGFGCGGSGGTGGAAGGAGKNGLVIIRW